MMGFGDVREPRQGGSAIVAGCIGFAQSERGIGPGGLQAGGFAQFAEARFVFVGEQAAHEMLEGVEAQRALELGKILRSQRIGFVVGGEQMPDNPGVQVHQGIERTGFADRRQQSRRVDAERAGIDGERGAVGSERAEDDIVGVEILGDAQHGGAAELCGGGKAVAFELARAASVRIDLVTGIGKILDGEFFQAFAEPVEAWGGAGVFEREDEVDALLGGDGGRSTGGGWLLRLNGDVREKYGAAQKQYSAGAENVLNHLIWIVAEDQVGGF